MNHFFLLPRKTSTADSLTTKHRSRRKQATKSKNPEISAVIIIYALQCNLFYHSYVHISCWQCKVVGRMHYDFCHICRGLLLELLMQKKSLLGSEYHPTICCTTTTTDRVQANDTCCMSRVQKNEGRCEGA